MKIRSAEMLLRCATCPAEIHQHFESDQYVDAIDAEEIARQNSRWGTIDDPEGLTCPACQRKQAAGEKADRERRERNMGF